MGRRGIPVPAHVLLVHGRAARATVPAPSPARDFIRDAARQLAAPGHRTRAVGFHLLRAGDPEAVAYLLPAAEGEARAIGAYRDDTTSLVRVRRGARDAPSSWPASPRCEATCCSRSAIPRPSVRIGMHSISRSEPIRGRTIGRTMNADCSRRSSAAPRCIRVMSISPARRCGISTSATTLADSTIMLARSELRLLDRRHRDRDRARRAGT